MGNARLGQWYFYLLVFVQIFLKTEGLYVDITYLESAVAKGAGKLNTYILKLFIYKKNIF